MSDNEDDVCSPEQELLKRQRKEKKDLQVKLLPMLLETPVTLIIALKAGSC
jgi:hypothetical protein